MRALESLDDRWSTGAYAEPARALLHQHAGDVVRSLAAYDDLARAALRDRTDWTITHGEPHSGNVLRTADGLRVIDWDSALLAPPERDLWMLLSPTGEDAFARPHRHRGHPAGLAEPPTRPPVNAAAVRGRPRRLGVMTGPRGRPEAIVRPKAAGQAFEVERIPPSAALAEFVDYYWLVRWQVKQPFRQQVVPQPRVHVAAERGRLLVHGVSREPFFRTLTGSGHVLGAAFHAGGFRPLLRAGLGTVSGTVQPASDLLGYDDAPVAARILEAADARTPVEELEGYLLRTDPQPDPVTRQVTDLVAVAEERTDITRAEALARHAGFSLRTLQRLFTEYVGVGPKWVIQRFRILEAAGVAHSGEPVDWAALAVRLGFSDQAHLVRVFTAVVGTPPAAYVRDPDT